MVHQVNVATRHKEAPQARKCCAAVQHSLACKGQLSCRGACTAEHAEHEYIRLCSVHTLLSVPVQVIAWKDLSPK